ncbi:hypothetical protein B6U99_07065 [Candidatus Geothermarchaeota archaeon ex4572_27]|nr:MAG: hypothetical protein B6U99_07065 [Candidatus Geothermarchaeota archaeon ex4572_27]
MAVKVLLRRGVSGGWKFFLTGFQGIGFTGYIAVKHLVNTLSASPIGVVEAPFVPPFVWMDGDRLISPIQLYEYGPFVFLVAEALPPPRDQYKLIRAVADWVAESGFEEAILIGGLDQRFQRGDEKVRCAVTGAYLRTRGLRVPLIERGLLITGPLALMLHRFEVNDFPAIALLPYANASRPDPMAAANAISTLNELYGLNVDCAELVKDAERIEQEVKEMMERQAAERPRGMQAYI